MGQEHSKEEIIIAQAGNSGGLTNTPKLNGGNSFSTAEILGMIAFAESLVTVIYFVMKTFKRHLENKIRREIRISQELV